jgi:hypothetical protein
MVNNKCVEYFNKLKKQTDTILLNEEQEKLVRDWGNEKNEQNDGYINNVIYDFITGEQQPFLPKGIISLSHEKDFEIAYRFSEDNLLFIDFHFIFDDAVSLVATIAMKAEENKLYYTISRVFDVNGVIWKEHLIEKLLEEDYFCWMLEKVMYLTTYTLVFFTEYKNEVFIKQKKITSTVKKNQQNKRKNKSKSKRVVRLTKVVYELEVDESQKETLIKEKPKRQYERHIEAWTVRGHWRTTKTGKRVWVRPHVKGKGEIVPKTYTI